MYRPHYTTEEVLEELTAEFDSHDGVEAQFFREDNILESSSSESESDQELDLHEQPQLSRRRNFATKSQRLVCCLTSALNPKNYENIPPVKTTTQYSSFLEKPSSSATTISWINTKRVAVGRQPRASVILGNLGPTSEASSAMDCL